LINQAFIFLNRMSFQI